MRHRSVARVVLVRAMLALLLAFTAQSLHAQLVLTHNETFTYDSLYHIPQARTDKWQQGDDG